MSYCINPRCQQRQNLDNIDRCQACGTALLINERIRLIKPLRSPSSHHYTEIFEVDDIGTRKVLKVLHSRDPKLIELISREALVLQLLEHPGIPRATRDDYFTFIPNNSSLELHCLVMQKFAGHNLEQWVEIHGRLSQALALNWLKQLVEIIDLVHRSGFFHRDIKPENIILQPDGQLALIDFGAVREVTNTYLAKLSGGGGTSTGLGGQHEITVIRTACYSPLEQINGQAVPQSDFYALGRTFTRLMTGTSLLKLPTDRQTGKLIWRNKAPQIDKPLAEFIDELMAIAPGKRPQNAQAILQYLNGRLPLLLRLGRVTRSVQFKAGVGFLFALALIGTYKGYKGVLIVASRFYSGLGSQAQIAGHLQDARRNYERAIKYDPNDVATYNNLALVCQELRDLSCAEASYSQVFRLNPSSWEGHYNLGSFYDDQGDYDRASAQYRLAIEANNGLAVAAINNLSRLKNRKGEYAAAATLAHQGLEKTQEPMQLAALYKNLGWSALGQNRYVEAKNYLQKARQLDPQRVDAYCLLAQVQEALGEMSSAKLSWEVCLLADSNLPEVGEWRERVLQRLLKN